MANHVTTAHSFATDSRKAVQEIEEALRQDKSTLPTQVCLVFVGENHDLDFILNELERMFSEAEIVGCTTSGEFTQSAVSSGGVAVLLIHSDNMTTKTTVSTGMDETDRFAESLAQDYETTHQLAKGKRQLHGTALMLLDGTKLTCEAIVKEFSLQTSAFLQIVGGGAADNGTFSHVRLGTPGNIGTDIGLVLQVFTPTQLGLGIGHGLVASGQTMTATKTDGHRIIEIDGKPAEQVYRQRLKDQGVNFEGYGPIPYVPGNEIGVYYLNRINRARAVIAMDDSGAIVCAGSVPNRSKICFLDSHESNLIRASREAAQQAKEALKGRKAVGAILFDCACRKAVLKEEFGRGVEAVSSELGGVPVAGFMTYGEIARYSKQLVGWHNTTAVVVAIPES